MADRPVGTHPRSSRQRRRMSRLDLASEADISSRRLSFLETGRSAASRDIILRLADHERAGPERNLLLVAGGCAPQLLD